MADYKKNKHAQSQKREGITYFFADRVVEISLREFLLSGTELTKGDFEHWKSIMDHMHLVEKRAYGRESYRNVNLDAVRLEDALKAPSAEEQYLCLLDQAEKAANSQFQLMTAIRAVDTLKRKQKRRFLLHVVHQLSTREIAEIEGTSHVAIHLSIQSARAKIKKFLENLENEQKTP